MQLRCLVLLPMILLTQTGRAQTAVSPISPVRPVSSVPLPPDLSLIHLDTPIVPAKAALSAYGEVRAFGGEEDRVYTGIGVQYGLGGDPPRRRRCRACRALSVREERALRWAAGH